MLQYNEVCLDLTPMTSAGGESSQRSRSHEALDGASADDKRPRARRRLPRAELGPRAPRETSKLGQRWRLIQAMIELAARSGYATVTVEKVCAGAGVSPQSFYEQFSDKEDLLVAAYRACAEGLFGQMRSAMAAGELAQLPHRALAAFLRAVVADPDAARVLLIEAMAGGERVTAERRHALRRFEQRVADVLAKAPADAPMVDVPVIALGGALRAVVARHLRAYSEDELPARTGEGVAWLCSYARPRGSEPWSSSQAALLASAPALDPQAARAPALGRLPPRHRLSEGEVARHQRTRLLYATAEVTMQRGYASSGVEEIVAAARVAKPAFYAYFKDKQHAFLEAQRYPSQFVLERCTQAYYSVPEWPQRMWLMLSALLELISANRAISHLRLVECYAAGPEAMRRAEEIIRTFSIFIEEGYHYRPQAAELPRLCSQAIAGAIFEIVQRLVAAGRWDEVGRHLPQLAYIAIAPFVGAQEAIALIEEMKHAEPDRDGHLGSRRGLASSSVATHSP